MDLGKEFDKFVQNQQEGAIKEFEETGSVMHSTVMLTMNAGKLARGAIIMPEEVINNRDLYYALIKQLVQQTRAIAICFVAESWVGGNKDMRASEDPNRREAVVINATRYNPSGAVIDNRVTALMINRDVEPPVLLSEEETLKVMAKRAGEDDIDGFVFNENRLANDTGSGPDYFRA
jgi:hypothetical protein